MSRMTLSRRALLGYAPAAAVAASVSPSLFAGTPAAAQSTSGNASGPQLPNSLGSVERSIKRAFAFQEFMMDAYATGDTVRLTQSYSDEVFTPYPYVAFTYDNAVAIHAYLATDDAALQKRAVILGEGLLYGQAHPYPFPINDGRFPQAFFVNAPATDGSGAYVQPAATPFYFYSSATGDQAWAGMALAQLYYRTNQIRFLLGALLVADWIVSNTYDTGTPGGYKFGTVIAYINGQNVSQPSTNGKSTEHNIDVYAFFTMLSKLTNDAKSGSINMKWSQLANHARQFVEAMYNPAGPYFYTGTQGDQTTINPSPIPEDVQTWSYLAFEDKAYQGTIDWALANLEATDNSGEPQTALVANQRIHGMVFDTASLTTTKFDPQAVWLEGTGHTIAALVARVLRGRDTIAGLNSDLQTAAAFVEQSILAQDELGMGKTVNGKPIPQGRGLVAATGALDTGFGYTYGPSLHIGATGWYLLGALAANPFRLGYRVVG